MWLSQRNAFNVRHSVHYKREGRNICIENTTFKIHYVSQTPLITLTLKECVYAYVPETKKESAIARVSAHTCTCDTKHLPVCSNLHHPNITRNVQQRKCFTYDADTTQTSWDVREHRENVNNSFVL